MALGTRSRTSTTTDIWFTPPEIVKNLGPFDLDPCTEKERPWQTADVHYTVEDNGLKKRWNGFVWCNPPYGNQTQHWLKKMAEHNNGIALVFARTETKMFFDFVWPKAKAILFIKGRLSFYHQNGEKGKMNSGGPSVLIAYGDEGLNRLVKSEIDGKIVYL